MQPKAISDKMLALPRGWIVLGLASAGWIAVALLWQALQMVVSILVG